MAQTQTTRIFSVSYIGDLVMATTALPLSAAACHGLSVVAAPAAAPLLVADPRLAAVHVVRSSWPLVWRAEVLAQLLRARRAGESVLNLEVYAPRWRFVARCCRLLRLPARHLALPALLADNQRSACGQPTTRSHRSDYYALAVGGEPPAPPLRLSVDNTLGEQAQQRLFGRVPTRQSLVLTHLGSSDSRRRAPPKLLADLLARLSTEAAFLPVLVGSASDADLARQVLERLGPATPVLDACGCLNLRELAALTSLAALFVGGDSGPLKIAEAVGARTLSFWQADQPSATFAGPRGSGHVALPATATLDEADSAARALLSR